MSSRTRGAKNQTANHLVEENLKEGQDKLHKTKLAELKERYKNNDI
jgi:hypothetical protein